MQQTITMEEICYGRVPSKDKTHIDAERRADMLTHTHAHMHLPTAFLWMFSLGFLRRFHFHGLKSLPSAANLLVFRSVVGVGVEICVDIFSCSQMEL